MADGSIHEVCRSSAQSNSHLPIVQRVAMRQLILPLIVALVLHFSCLSSSASAQEKPAEPKPPATEPPAAKDPPGLKRITKDYDVWVDPKRRLVIVDGVVCLTEGQLEMFACSKGTKEHESVIAINSPARWIHAGLLLVKAKPGNTVRFQPEYAPAKGPIVDVHILWRDKDGKKHNVRGQQFVKHVPTGKVMPYEWVFAGSGFWTDERTKENHYEADSGDFICVSNFPTATLDLPVESSQANANLLFEAFTQNIPPRGTKIRMVLAPRQDKKKDESGEEKVPAKKVPASDTDQPK